MIPTCKSFQSFVFHFNWLNFHVFIICSLYLTVFSISKSELFFKLFFKNGNFVLVLPNVQIQWHHLFCQKAHTKLFKKRSHWLKSAQNVWFSENNWQHYLVYKSVICDGMFINKYGQNISKTAKIACRLIFQRNTNLVTFEHRWRCNNVL